MKINVGNFHYLKIENNRCFLYYRTTQTCVRELDEYETQLVLAAYKEGVIDGKNSRS